MPYPIMTSVISMPRSQIASVETKFHPQYPSFSFDINMNREGKNYSVLKASTNRILRIAKEHSVDLKKFYDLTTDNPKNLPRFVTQLQTDGYINDRDRQNIMCQVTKIQEFVKEYKMEEMAPTPKVNINGLNVCAVKREYNQRTGQWGPEIINPNAKVTYDAYGRKVISMTGFTGNVGSIPPEWRDHFEVVSDDDADSGCETDESYDSDDKSNVSCGREQETDRYRSRTETAGFSSGAQRREEHQVGNVRVIIDGTTQCYMDASIINNNISRNVYYGSEIHIPTKTNLNNIQVARNMGDQLMRLSDYIR